MKLMRVTKPEVVYELIEKHFHPLDTEKVELDLAGGRYLAEAVYASEDMPAFNRSTVDGYAVFARDSFGASEGLPAVFDCVGEVPMGEVAPVVEQGQCCLVHTGGMLPEGTDAVIMVEDTELMGKELHGYRQVAPGENVIHQGEDMRRGDTALAAGSLLRAPELGLLASLGVTEVTVYRTPVIGLLSTGDELVPADTAELPLGKIRDCNAPSLAYLAKQAGAKVITGGILPDSFTSFLEQSRSLLEQTDLLVLSGGSSVGARDFTARAMQELGKPGLLVEGIAIKPGKPTLLADCNGKPVLGLPGHPVSALIIFSLFGKAILGRLSGKVPKPYRPSVHAKLSRNLPSRSGQTEYVRVRLEPDESVPLAVPVFGRSGMLRTLADADGVIVVKAEKEGLYAGESVEVFPWE